MVIPALVQTGAGDPSQGISKDEKNPSREGTCESKLATVEKQQGEIDSYLRDIGRRIEACIENNRARWEACQNFHRQSQRRLDRLELLARQATNQQIQLTHMYQKREEESSMYHVV